MVITHKLTDEQKKILERMHSRVDYIFETYTETLMENTLWNQMVRRQLLG